MMGIKGELLNFLLDFSLLNNVRSSLVLVLFEVFQLHED